MSDTFTCALSGATYTEGPIDTINDTPVPRGWGALTLLTTAPNPRRVEVETAKAASLNMILAQAPTEGDADQLALIKRALTYSVEAQWHALLADTPEVQEDETTIYLNLTDPAVGREWAKLAKALGF